MALTATQKDQLGQGAMKYFHEYSVKNFPTYRLTQADLIRKLREKNIKILELLGSTISTSGKQPPQVKEIMEGIAKQTKGEIPTQLSTLLRPFSNPDDLDYTTFEYLKDVTSSVASGVGDTAAAVGDGLIATAKLSTILVPIALAIAAGVLLYQKGKVAQQ